MVGVCAPEQLEAVSAVCGKWELELAVIGAVTDSGHLRCWFDDQLVGDIPARLLTDECPRYRVETRPRSGRADTVDSRPAGGGLARAARLARSGQPRVGLRPVRPAASARGPCAAPGWTLQCSACGRPTGALRCRSTGPAGRHRSTRAPVGCSPSSRRPATSPARQGDRSPSPTASTSATRRSRRSPGSWPRRSRACRSRARRSAFRSSPATSPCYNETDGSAIYPTPVVGCLGLVDDVPSSSGRLAAGRCGAGCGSARAAPGRLRVPGGSARRRRRAAAAAEPCRRGGPHRVPRTGLRRSRAACTTPPRAASRWLSPSAPSSQEPAQSSTCLQMPSRATERAVARQSSRAAAATAAASRSWPRSSMSHCRSVGEVGGDRLLDIPLDALRAAHAEALPRRLDR